MTSVNHNSRSGDRNIDGLLTAYRWSSSSVPLYYSFPGSGEWTGYPTGEEPESGFRGINLRQQGVIATIFQEISSYVAQISFGNAGSAGVAAAEATFRFGHSNLPETAYAYTPYHDEAAGDVWFNSTSRNYDDPVRGNYAYFTFLHEIGHALGLKHPHEPESFGNMPLDKDHLSFTVMSYRSYANMDIDEGGYTNGDNHFPQTFMLYDIAALQHMYGANFSARNGDTVYKWNPASGAVSVNGTPSQSPPANKIYMTVWDGGGTDTYDFSLYTTSLKIDLEPGAWIDTGGLQRVETFGPPDSGAPGAIANALLYKGDQRSLIEKAIAGSGDDILLGNAGPNELRGGRGDDTLDGRGGADVMAGGDGTDTYHADDTGDRIVETAGGGYDTVYVTAAVYKLDPHVETAFARRPDGGQQITGNAQANTLYPTSAGRNVLDGGGGADTMHGSEYGDTFYVDNPGDDVNEALAGRAGEVDLVISTISYAIGYYIENLTLSGSRAINGTGNSRANVLTGNPAANILDGLGGADVMKGMGGNDTYVVDSSGDRVIEDSATGGNDLVKSSVSYTLGPNLERLTLTGSAVTGNGNALANVITGNAAANVLRGYDGNDRLDGLAGADKMYGGNGNDTYVVERASDQAIEESAAGGVDTVLSSVSFALGVHVENLTLTGAAANGVGNALANILNGTGGANILNGGGGADVMKGWGGNDVYVVDHAGDRAIESSAAGGLDTVKSSVSFGLGANVENLTLTGSAAIDGIGNGLANVITGNNGANLLRGWSGDDVLKGAGGSDKLFGGFGMDVLKGGYGGDLFYFDTALGPTNVDTILDFERGRDRIVLENSVFKGLAAGALSSGAFAVGNAAADAGDRIVYDQATGKLFYDADGTGAAAAIQFALLDTKPLLAASDFVVI